MPYPNTEMTDPDLECTGCGHRTTYGDAQIAQLRTSCPSQRWPGDTRHNFREVRP